MPMYRKGQFRRSCQEYLDQDYEHKLGLAERRWLNQFNQEYYLNNRQYAERIMGDEYNKLNSGMNNARDRDVMIKRSYSRDYEHEAQLKPAIGRKEELGALLNVDGFANTISALMEHTTEELSTTTDTRVISCLVLRMVTDSLELLRQERNYIRQEKKLAKD